MRVRSIPPGNRGHHAVQFYSDDERLCVSVADFLSDGLAAGQPTLVIATPEHRTRILLELTKRRFDVPALVSGNSLLLLDAKDTLDLVMTQGGPDAMRFRDVIGEAIARVKRIDPDAVVRAYGELVDVLWREEQFESAIKVEILWNDLAKKHSFSLLCGYLMGSFFKHSDRAQVCAQHTHVYDLAAI